MAPEQLRGEADARSDIYGLGATLFEALAGRRVFMGEHPHVLMMAVESEPPPSLPALHPEIPGAVDAVNGDPARPNTAAPSATTSPQARWPRHP